MINKKKTLFVAAAVSGMLAATGCSSTGSQTAEVATGQCHGVNACKGESACHTAKTSCSGQNSCKGQGWKKMTQEECDAKGGTFKS